MPTWPWGVQEVKVPGFLDNRHTNVVRLSALRTGCLYPQEYPELTPGTWTCRMPRKKSPVTQPGIDPGTFWLLAQCLNHYATPGPFPAVYQMNSPKTLIQCFSKILFNDDQTPTNTPSIKSLPSTCSKWGLHSLIISLILSPNPTHLLLMKLTILIPR
jgi:hypothetical protein